MHVPGPVMVQTGMEFYTIIMIVVTRNRLSCIGLECVHKHFGHLTMNEPIINYWGNKEMMSISIMTISITIYTRGPVDDISI